MAILNVKPTRMELTRLKKQVTSSMRGHKLLKDKRDDMIKKFLKLSGENLQLRKDLEKKMDSVYTGFILAEAYMGDKALQQALMLPKRRVHAEVEIINIMSVDVPSFEFRYADVEAKNLYPYGFAFTSGQLDESVSAVSEILPLMLELAETEKKVMLLAGEIEKTRRRVNALEYVRIPSLQETIKSITMKLDENERGNLARLMKLKDMMIAERSGSQ